MKRINRVQNALSCIRLTASISLIASVIIVSACSPQPANCARAEVFCVGLVTAYDGIDDRGLNQAAWESLQNIRTQAGIDRLDNIESIDTRDWQKNVSFFSENNYDVVITVGRNLSETTVAAAAKYSDTLFIGIDQQLSGEYPNIANIYFPEEQAGFLAGILAAMATKADEVGAVCEAKGIDSVWRYCEGFRAGAKYQNEEIRVVVVYRDSGGFDSAFNDPDWGKEMAEDIIDRGADILTGFGGNTAQGAYLLALEKGIPIIGAEDDLFVRLPYVQPVLITSIIDDPSVALSYLVVQASISENPVGAYVGQIKYTSFRGPNKALENEIESVLQRIRNGEIDIILPERK